MFAYTDIKNEYIKGCGFAPMCKELQLLTWI